jgi:hypothetical protein
VNVGINPDTVNYAPLRPALPWSLNPQKSLGQLFQPFVAILPRLEKNALDQRTQCRLSPVVPSRRFGTGGISQVSALEECPGRCEIE